MHPQAPHLLVVDDEEGITDFLKRCLERAGHSVATASGGWEAAKLLDAGPVAFVLTDIRMPHGDGVELLEHIEAMPGPRPAVAVMTAYADVQTAELFGRGACALFEKPLEMDEVITRIKSIVAPPVDRWVLAEAGPTPAYHLTLAFDDYAGATRRGEVRLGRGGLFVAMAGASPPVGTDVAFSLRFKDRLLSGQAVVVWVRQRSGHGFHAGLGLEIIGLTPETRAFVLAELAAAPQAYIPLGLKPTNAA